MAEWGRIYGGYYGINRYSSLYSIFPVRDNNTKTKIINKKKGYEKKESL